jgi:hypothetical protein
MKECDNSKIHISSNFILYISLLIMFDTLHFNFHSYNHTTCLASQTRYYEQKSNNWRLQIIQLFTLRLPQAPYSRRTSACVPPSMTETKFKTHIKHGQLELCIYMQKKPDYGQRGCKRYSNLISCLFLRKWHTLIRYVGSKHRKVITET